MPFSPRPSHDRAAVRPRRLLLSSALALLVGLGVLASGAVTAWSSTDATSIGSTGSAAVGAQTAPKAPAARFPTRRSAGVPAHWEPKRTVTGDYTVSRAGAVVEDLRILGGDLIIAARNVTVRRVDLLGGSIDNFRGRSCANGLVITRSTIRRGSDRTRTDDMPAVGTGGYTARGVEIVGRPEGFRVGGQSGDCGPVRIVRSYAHVTSPDECGDWHGDALQGYDAPRLTIRDSYLRLDERNGCGGTAPFFYPADQGNASVDIDGLVVEGGGYAFRLGQPGSVRNLRLVRGSWYYGPIDVKCRALGTWSAKVVDLNSAGQPVRARAQRCNTNGGY